MRLWCWTIEVILRHRGEILNAEKSNNEEGTGKNPDNKDITKEQERKDKDNDQSSDDDE